jgi:hypothetical protein
MKGKPKFKYEEKVKFKFGDKIKEGTIYIIDEYGTWDDPSDVSYDIMSTTDDGRKCLFKHITEKLVSKLND